MSIAAIPVAVNPAPSARIAPATGAAQSVPADAAPGATETAKPAASSHDTTTLTPQALALIDKLKARDTEVRQHEQAHLAAAGGLAVSGAAYTYQRGPNGVDYAVGGEVHIDTSPGRTPEETIARAHTIEAAALAPAEPSGADRSVAAQAQQLERQARAELAIQDAQKALGAAQQPPVQTAPSPPAATPDAPAGPGTQTPQVAQLLATGAQQQAGAAPLNKAYDLTPPVPPRLDTYA